MRAQRMVSILKNHIFLSLVKILSSFFFCSYFHNIKINYAELSVGHFSKSSGYLLLIFKLLRISDFTNCTSSECVLSYDDKLLFHFLMRDEGYTTLVCVNVGFCLL